MSRGPFHAWGGRTVERSAYHPKKFSLFLHVSQSSPIAVCGYCSVPRPNALPRLSGGTTPVLSHIFALFQRTPPCSGNARPLFLKLPFRVDAGKGKWIWLTSHHLEGYGYPRITGNGGKIGSRGRVRTADHRVKACCRNRLATRLCVAGSERGSTRKGFVGSYLLEWPCSSRFNLSSQRNRRAYDDNLSRQL